jgi:hypothetical protein
MNSRFQRSLITNQRQYGFMRLGIHMHHRIFHRKLMTWDSWMFLFSSPSSLETTLCEHFIIIRKKSVIFFLKINVLVMEEVLHMDTLCLVFLF